MRIRRANKSPTIPHGAILLANDGTDNVAISDVYFEGPLLLEDTGALRSGNPSQIGIRGGGPVTNVRFGRARFWNTTGDPDVSSVKYSAAGTNKTNITLDGWSASTPFEPNPAPPFPLPVVVAPGVRTTSSNPVRRSQEIVDIFGVAGHLTYPAYSDYNAVVTAMDYLGCKRFRDGWGTGRQPIADLIINQFRPRGIKLCLVHDSRDWPAGTTAAQMVAEHKARGILPDILYAEGSNELDLSGNLASARTQALAHTAAYKAEPAAAHIIRCGPSLADTNADSKYQAVGVLPDATAMTFHDYPGGDFQMSGPVSNTDASYAITNTLGRNARYNVPTPSGTPVPVISTETGFSDGTTGDAGKNMPRAAGAAQELRIWLEHARGIGGGDRAVDVMLSCHYELKDQGTGTDTEQRFGLFDASWQPKPAATAIRNAIALLRDGNANALTFAPAQLGHTLTGTTSLTRSLFMQKSDGSWWLALWQQEKTWNGTTTLNPPPVTVTLTVPSTRTVTSYDPVSSQTGTVRGTGTSFALQSSATPQLIKVV